MARDLVLALDQGTTSSRAILYDRAGRALAAARRELPQRYPAPGLVEHDPETIWRDVLAVAQAAAEGHEDRLAAVGITNQRETTLLWRRADGRPIGPAIVWQDRRTAETCRRLAAEGHGGTVARRTGLLLDPYFSATKIAWLLDHMAGARAAAARGELAFGTVDSWLVWQLTGGRVHATDATNAARTLLFDIHRQVWDEDLCRLFGVPMALLPEVRDCDAGFGTCDGGIFGRPVEIGGIAGDQQAALIGQACFQPGALKSTYGTGCFAVMNTGTTPVASANRLLTTVAYRLAGRTTYALEGSIFVAGAAVQWLRDGLKLIASAADTERLAHRASDAPVYMVPAFAGLGAPWWDAEARGAIFGLTRDTGPAELARAALDAVCHQTRDLLDAMGADAGRPVALLRVDGGMTENGWLLQRLADLTGIAVERPADIETTALGAARLAGMRAGLVGPPEEAAREWQAAARFTPALPEAARAKLHAGWLEAVGRVRTAK